MTRMRSGNVRLGDLLASVFVFDKLLFLLCMIPLHSCQLCKLAECQPHRFGGLETALTSSRYFIWTVVSSKPLTDFWASSATPPMKYKMSSNQTFDGHTDSPNFLSSSSSSTSSSSNAAMRFFKLSYMAAGSTGAGSFFLFFGGWAPLRLVRVALGCA